MSSPDMKADLQYQRRLGSDLQMKRAITVESYRDWNMTTEDILQQSLGESSAWLKRFRNSGVPESARDASDATIRVHLKEQLAILVPLIRHLESAHSPQTPITATASSSSASNSQVISNLIITVTKVEARAVLEVFSKAAGKDWSRQVVGNKTYYNLGIHGGSPVFMVQSEMGTATPGGALVTVSQAIQVLRPQAVVMCGIAFGLRPDGHQLGDILIAKQLLYYESQKMDLKQGQIPRGDRITSSERLLDRFHSGELDWQGAPTHFGLILSGEKLVNDPAFRNWLLETEPEAIGGEMEGAGLYIAARDAKVDWILVKAICDWADGNKNNDTQPLAARNAAQFVLHVLRLGG